MVIDAHVHLRDEEQSYKETIRHGLEVARDSGVYAVFDMPNTQRPVIDEERVRDRLRIAKDADVPEVFYGLYLGMTADPEQIKRAVDVFRKYPQVVGFKLYAGHSVGNLGITTLGNQLTVYQTLSEEGYDGVLVVHCEKEALIRKEIWNPQNPISHCHARPERSELESLNDQLYLSEDTGFKGKLHIAHISSPDAVDLLIKAKEKGLAVSSGICPHHFIYDWEQMRREDGVLWKMNPPLRSPQSRERMLGYLRQGKIDLIETDHAPHGNIETGDLAEKTVECMSGVPGLPWWPVFKEYLRRHGFSEHVIEDLTYRNPARLFGLDISNSRHVNFVDRRSDYPFNPYSGVEKMLGWNSAWPRFE